MDAKSVRSASAVHSQHQLGSASGGDSVSLTGSKASARRMRATLLAQKKRGENQPTRRLLFRPRVYDFWREGDMDFEQAEKARILRDIAQKEARLKEKRRLRKLAGGGDEEDDFEDSDDENEVVKALDRLKTRKQREEEYKEKLEADKKRQEEIENLELEEKLASELQNPTVFGLFYTDGYYDNHPYFGVRHNIVEKLRRQQADWQEKWSKRYPETFTQMFKRFFWPPKYLSCCGKPKSCFRTRGSYMDFPEVIADWPKGVEVDFEKEPREYISNRHVLFGEDAVTGEDEDEEEDEGEGLDGDADSQLGKKKKKRMDWDFAGSKYNSDAWYYDDEEGQFFRKRLGFDIEYYYDGVNHCWRHKKKRGRYVSENQQTPYDFYFDDKDTLFYPRDEYSGIDEIYFDQKLGVYRIHKISNFAREPVHKRNEKGQPVYFAPGFEPAKEDEEENKPKHKVNDFYFDEEYGNWFLRTELPKDVDASEIKWDDNGRRYARKFEGVFRGLTGLSPDDYYWQDRLRKFVPKAAKQGDSYKYFQQDGVWRKKADVSPTSPLHSEDIGRWYFDDFEGQFKPKDMSTSGGARYIQGKYSKIWRQVAKPKSNMYPDEFYWDNYKKRWLPKSVRLEMLRNAELARQRNMQENRKGIGPAGFDIQQGDKNLKPEDFYWDTSEGMYLRKISTETYYYDDQDACFKQEANKDQPRSARFLHEYYFDKNGPVLKDPNGSYTYDDKFKCWKKVGGIDLNTLDPPPTEYCYDLNTEEFKKKNDEKRAEYNASLGWYVVPSNAPNYKSPDDYYFSEADGRFLAKDAGVANAGGYVYDQTIGAWKEKGVKSGGGKGYMPRNFYWDDGARGFKLKVKSREKEDYYWDPSTKIFKHVASSGKNKSGRKPRDYVWNNEFKAWVPANLKTGRGQVVDDLPEWDPQRLYDKGWQADGKYVAGSNKVSPAPSTTAPPTTAPPTTAPPTTAPPTKTPSRTKPASVSGKPAKPYKEPTASAKTKEQAPKEWSTGGTTKKK